MAVLKLKSGRVLLDDADLYWALSTMPWYINDNGYVYRQIRLNDKLSTSRMHRELLKAPRGVDVDHRNGDRRDNRRSNLRLATRSQNLKNKTVLRSDNRSGVTGVYWHKQVSKWTVQIQLNGKPKHLGLFVRKSDAIKVRRAAELQYYAEFAPQKARKHG